MRLTAVTLLLGFGAMLGACGDPESQTPTVSSTSSSVPTGAASIDLDCDSFAGRWSGTEDRGAEADEGGVYRTQVNIPLEGEASVMVSDTIEIFESWECEDGEIVLIDWQDGTTSLAVVDADTVEYRGERLERVAAD